MKSRLLLILLFSWILLSCVERETIEPAISNQITDINADCTWETKRSNFQWNKDLFVTFSYKICSNDSFETIAFLKPYELEARGTKIGKFHADVIFDSFSVIEYDGLEIASFLKSLVKKNFEHEGVCKPKLISKNKWIIEDGLPLDIEINYMPCGSFGRNFAGQTVFTINEMAILHHNMPTSSDEIDKSSIKLEVVQ